VFAHLKLPTVPPDAPKRMLEAAVPHWRARYLACP
jgi:hypothetical protein